MSALRLAAKATRRTARDVWETTLARATERMQVLTERFTAGAIGEAEYVLEMRGLVKSLHMGALAVGSGGVDAVTARDLRRLGPLLRDEYRHLARKVGRIQGEERTASQEIASVSGFADRALGTFENARVAAASDDARGRWTLHAAESCDGCEAQAARGVQPIKDFPPHGSQPCGSRCRCEIVPSRG